MDLFGTAFAAIVGVALWDVVRMFIQTWYLEKRIGKNDNNCCCCHKCNNESSEKEDDNS